MGSFGKKPLTDSLKVALVAALILCVVVVEATEGAKEHDNKKNFESRPQKNEFMVGMPLYRVKAKPGMLIPESKIQTVSKNSASP